MNAKRPKLIPVMGQLGTSTRLNCHWGLGCLMGTFNHLISNGLVWSMGSCFCPSLGAFTSLTHTMQVYQLRFGHPVWRSLVTAVRILPNIGPPASKKNFPGCKYTWGNFGRRTPKTLWLAPAPLNLLDMLEVCPNYKTSSMSLGPGQLEGCLVYRVDSMISQHSPTRSAEERLRGRVR